jgi:serine protease SohB
MHLLIEYLLFLAKTATLVFAILMVITSVIAASSKNKKLGDRITITKLNDRYKETKKRILKKTLDKKALKKLKKSSGNEKKDKDKVKPNLYVIEFKGDMRATQVASLKEEITAILLAAQPKDEVLLRLDSPGGTVNGYGLAASQLARLKAANIKLTVAVDQVAASGGYMMAAVADRIIAAPFAIIGSVGVVAQLPNFHRLLDKNNIDFEQITAGKYKRTLTMFGENTDEGREKMQADIEAAHQLFKAHISQHRQQVDIEAIATGEYWFGTRAAELKLVDELLTSDDFLLQCHNDYALYGLEYEIKPSLINKLTHQASLFLERSLSKTVLFRHPEN